ncbi:hypothetical protein B0I37DRAFT_431182 [Chaetomium sp. MPI-CAGE-AT-0009]|nr:hypothetical protein B0I37DRAFT_431182 [Chaetomium sp. MPI-CAGE-AT-0009]
MVLPLCDLASLAFIIASASGSLSCTTSIANTAPHSQAAKRWPSKATRKPLKNYRSMGMCRPRPARVKLREVNPNQPSRRRFSLNPRPDPILAPNAAQEESILPDEAQLQQLPQRSRTARRSNRRDEFPVTWLMEARNRCTVTPTQRPGEDPNFAMVQRGFSAAHRRGSSHTSASEMGPNGAMSRCAERDRRDARSETGHR